MKIKKSILNNIQLISYGYPVIGVTIMGIRDQLPLIY